MITLPGDPVFIFRVRVFTFWYPVFTFFRETVPIFFLINYIVEFEFYHFFDRILAPTQWAAGGCPPLKEPPGREPAAGEIFLYLLVPNRKNNQNLIIFVMMRRSPS